MKDQKSLIKSINSYTILTKGASNCDHDCIVLKASSESILCVIPHVKGIFSYIFFFRCILCKILHWEEENKEDILLENYLSNKAIVLIVKYNFNFATKMNTDTHTDLLYIPNLFSTHFSTTFLIILF